MNRILPIALAISCFTLSGCVSESVNDSGTKTPAGSQMADAGKKAAAGKKADADKNAEPKKADGNWSVGDTIPSGMNGVPPIKILKVHKNGSGAACGTGKSATLKYKAMKADGSVLDPGTRPFTFTVGGGQAIRGWDVIVAKMRIGDSFTVHLPKQLAYGDAQGDLKFDMELLSVK